jgi:hypothetical protein
LNSFIEIVLAVTTASSAVAALWLWNTQVGQELWKYILVISAILAVVKPVIKLTDKMQQFEEILAGYRSLEHDLKTIVIRIRQSKKYGMPHRTKLLEALTRQGELLKKLPEAKPEKKLQEKCRLQVMKELPVEYFFVPKDK